VPSLPTGEQYGSAWLRALLLHVSLRCRSRPQELQQAEAAAQQQVTAKSEQEASSSAGGALPPPETVAGGADAQWRRAFACVLNRVAARGRPAAVGAATSPEEQAALLGKPAGLRKQALMGPGAGSGSGGPAGDCGSESNWDASTRAVSERGGVGGGGSGDSAFGREVGTNRGGAGGRELAMAVREALADKPPNAGRALSAERAGHAAACLARRSGGGCKRQRGRWPFGAVIDWQQGHAAPRRDQQWRV
jgi:hypothetical protein